MPHGAGQSPMNSTSATSSMPNRSRTVATARSASIRTSVALPFLSLRIQLACRSEITAPPIRWPLRPAASMSRPAESPGGLRKTLPALGIPSGWCARRHALISSSRAAMTPGSSGASVNDAVTTTSGGDPAGACFRRLSR